MILVAIGLIVTNIFLKSKKNQEHSGNKQLGSKFLAGDTEQLSIIFSSIEEGLILIDDNKSIVLLNSAAALITGWGVEDAIGIDISTVVKVADNQGKPYINNNYPFNKVFSTGKYFKDNDLVLITRDNKLISIGLNISPLSDKDGNVTGAVALIRNMTEEKNQESRLADFISTASHEMRTPVAAIEGYLSLALNNKVATIDNKARDYLEKAEEATRHLGQLFQDLLTSAKAEDGRLVSHPEVVEMGDMLKKLTEDLKFSAEKHGLKTEFIVGTNPANKSDSHLGVKTINPLYYVYVDPDRLREVITNLYDNAVKYTPEGKITIGITGDSQVVQFYVKDTGSGIPAEDIPHLFQKFYRVDNSATRTVGGTGLGLYICKKIIELYNGRVWVESKEGKGSTFYINIPRLSTPRAKELLNNPEILPTNTNTIATT